MFDFTCRARRAAKEAKESPAQPAPEKTKVEIRKFVKIGRPGYKGKPYEWMFNDTPARKQIGYWVSEQGRCMKLKINKY